MVEARAAAGDGDPAELRRLRDDLARRLEQYRRMLAEEVRGRLRDKSHGVAGTGLVAPRRLEDVDVLAASTTELRQMRQAVRPLARKLASRREPAASPPSTRPRRHAPHDPPLTRVWRRADGRRPASSASGQARRRRALRHLRIGRRVRHFTLLLLHALQSELAGLRSFVFVDGVAEVTGGAEAAEVHLDPLAAGHVAGGDRGRWAQ